MKENEGIAGLKVQEAIQSGLRSQQIHRALQERKLQSRPMALDAHNSPFQSSLQSQVGWLYSLLLLVSAVLHRGAR